jgi:hypothetical protein
MGLDTVWLLISRLKVRFLPRSPLIISKSEARPTVTRGAGSATDLLQRALYSQ